MRISDWSSDVCSSDLLDEEGKYLVGKIEADFEGDEQGRERPDETATQLDQVVHQRRAAVVDILHGSSRRSSPSCDGGISPSGGGGGATVWEAGGAAGADAGETSRMEQLGRAAWGVSGGQYG